MGFGGFLLHYVPRTTFIGLNFRRRDNIKNENITYPAFSFLSFIYYTWKIMNGEIQSCFCFHKKSALILSKLPSSNLLNPVLIFFKISCSINPFLILYRKIKRTSWKIETPLLNIHQTFLQQFLIFAINFYQSQDKHYRNKPLVVFWTQERTFRYLISNVATSIRNSTIPFYFYFLAFFFVSYQLSGQSVGTRELDPSFCCPQVSRSHSLKVSL